MYLDRFIAAVRDYQLAAGHDANIPRFTAGETLTGVAWDVTVQLGAFLAVPVLAVILITESWEQPAAAALVGALFMGTRHSYLRYQRVSLT
ncbi:hypothetical protein [Streptomyces sp. NBC_00887]|uniref:hypothetical protein n=1 Tax=Streptomyces sp. NBC_00887 TaxID=2975859 RepID=UPI0038638BFC|nr:hypothetical protein OG844_00255 [Streptomyces sp. NBC_00887]WSY36362.1 hypothetical protein OG844_45345 [Streptomyces sp. NBC_00887]